MSFDYEWDQQRARTLIGCLVDETGLSATEIARRSGLAPSTLTRIYPSPSVGYSLSSRSIGKIKQAFPEAFALCEDGTAAAPSSPPMGIVRERAHPFAAPGPKLIPVYATTLLFPEESSMALASELEVWEGDVARPVAYMAMPFRQGDAERYFAIYIPGDAMEPRFRAGERVILDRIKPASIDTDVLVQLSDDTGRSLWTIGRLNTRDRNIIGLMQYRDKATASIHRSKVKHVFPIIGMIDDDS